MYLIARNVAIRLNKSLVLNVIYTNKAHIYCYESL